MVADSDRKALRRLGSLCVVALWITAGCDAAEHEARHDAVDPPAHIEATAAESVDVERVEAGLRVSAPSSDSPAEWVPVRVRRIETAEPTPADEPLLYNPRAMFRFEDGTLVLEDAGGAHRLVVIDPEEGSARARFARSGSGPAEIRGSWISVWSEDGASISVLDRMNLRVSRFSPDGELLSELRYEPPRAGLEQIAIRYDTGDVFAIIGSMDTEGDHSIARLDLEMGIFEPLVGLGPRPPLPRGAQPGMVLFQPRQLLAALPGGGIIAGRTDGASFKYYSSSGELIREFRLPITARPIRDGDLQEFFERFGSAGGGAIPRDGLRVSSHFNVYLNMYAVDDSLFAIQHGRFALPAEDTPPPADVFYWRIISVRGHEVARVTFPEHFAPRFVHRRRTLGVAEDSLGIAAIEEFELAAPAPPSDS